MCTVTILVYSPISQFFIQEQLEPKDAKATVRASIKCDHLKCLIK